MSDKPKRKHHYRRWWAFRGLLIALIIFLGTVGYLLTRQSENEYIYFTSGGMLRHISIVPNATPGFIGEVDEYFYWNDRVHHTSANWLIYSPRLQNEIRYIDLVTGEDNVLIDCQTVAISGKCLSFDLQPDGNLLVYNFYYTSPEPPHEFFEVRLFNIERNTDMMLFEVEQRIFEVRWIHTHQIEYTTLSRELWSYDFNTQVQQQIDLPNYRLYSPDSSYYIMRTFNTEHSRWYYEYTVYNSDHTPITEEHSFTTESHFSICWQPNSKGVLYYELSTATGMPINRSIYYDVSTKQNHYLYEQISSTAISAFWSPSGRYVLIHGNSESQGNGSYLYDMQSQTRRWLTGITAPFWLDKPSHCWLRFPAG